MSPETIKRQLAARLLVDGCSACNASKPRKLLDDVTSIQPCLVHTSIVYFNQMKPFSFDRRVENNFAKLFAISEKKNYQLKGTSTSCIVHPPTTNVSRGFLTQKWYAVENRSRSNYLQFVIATNAIEEKKHYRCAAAASLSHPRSMWTRALVWGFYCCCCNLRRCRRSSQTAVGCFASLANRVAESKTRFQQLCNEKKKTETSREVLRAPRDCWILIKATIK